MLKRLQQFVEAEAMMEVKSTVEMKQNKSIRVLISLRTAEL